MTIRSTVATRLGRPGRAMTPVATRIAAAPAATRSALIRRLQVLNETLGGAPTPDPHRLVAAVAERLDAGREDEIWLALAVLAGELPDLTRVQRVVRSTRLDGAAVAFDRELFTPMLAIDPPGPWRSVEVVRGQVVVDINHATRTELSTGIQRVTRESGKRWLRDHAPIFVNWHQDAPAFGRLSPEDARRSLEDARIISDEDAADRPVLVPWRSTYVLAELHSDVGRAEYLHAMLRFSGNRSAAIGFDCVPLTTAETVREGMGNGFAAGLAALAHADRIACISGGAQVEYEGWRKMLGGTGLAGPDTAAILLPGEARTPTTEGLGHARNLFVLGNLPMVLCVGSHEPRKNHLAVLHAAELLWRRGIQFSLAFVGGSGWQSERFEQRVRELQAANRPVQTEKALADDLLWGAYRLARCTLFPSLNEGFGLPVAESLASGTPVITSNFGSMAEIAEGGGALLVDPRDDHAIADAIERLVTDDELNETLRAEAAARVPRTWEQYAAETWAYLVADRPST